MAYNTNIYKPNIENQALKHFEYFWHKLDFMPFANK